MSFDRLARHYSWLEVLLAGKKLHQCRTAFLEEARDIHTALLAGEGHGRFLAELRGVAPNAAITCVEQSAPMIRAAQERLMRAGRDASGIRFVQGDLLTCELDTGFDLVATHFFLDCFPEPDLETVVHKLTAALSPGGKWMLSDFQIPTRGWQAVRARIVLKLAYSFFRVATRLPARRLVAPQGLLLRNGLRLKARREFNFRLLYAELWRLPM